MKTEGLTNQDLVVIEAALSYVVRKHNVGILEPLAEETLRRVRHLAQMDVAERDKFHKRREEEERIREFEENDKAWREVDAIAVDTPHMEGACDDF